VNEEEVKIKYVLPWLKQSGVVLQDLQFEQTFSVKIGRQQIFVGERSERTRAGARLDILVRRGNRNLFVVETKADSLALTDDDPLYMAFLHYCEHQGFRPTGRLLVQTSQLAEELVARELGWTVVDFRTASMRRKDVVVTPLQPYVECSMNAFFAKNHSPTLLARRLADTVKTVLKEGVQAGELA